MNVNRPPVVLQRKANVRKERLEVRLAANNNVARR